MKVITGLSASILRVRSGCALDVVVEQSKQTGRSAITSIGKHFQIKELI
ncbi:MAG TPA: hypothetical protein VHO70_14375 [Chitinispirillaceae bacterium]|nr:hypothetical protein [Chitinispirillaceae bacterium]